MYDCEIQGCREKTDGFLCHFHLREAMEDNKGLVICSKCLVIVTIEDRKKGNDKYRFIELCLRCKPTKDLQTDT